MLRLLTAIGTHPSPVTLIRTESGDRITDQIRHQIPNKAIYRVDRWSGTVKAHHQFGDWT
jgi:hypothetical protein